MKQVSRGVRGSWRLVTERRGIPEEASWREDAGSFERKSLGLRRKLEASWRL